MNGWTHSKYIAYKTIKNEIVKESRLQATKNWEEKINKLNADYGDPKKFWQNLKTLKGSSTPNKTHLLHNNKKIHDDADKEPIFREIWSNTFQITQQENQLFDQTTDTLVNNFINTHRTDIEPYTTTNLNNLSPDNPLTRKITHCEVTTIIKHMKTTRQAIQT